MFIVCYSLFIVCNICQALQSKPGSRVGELSVLTFRKECMQGLVKIVQKVQEKSPLKIPVVRAIGCLDPRSMHRDAEGCLTKMKTVVRTMLQDKQLAGGVSAGRKNIGRVKVETLSQNLNIKGQRQMQCMQDPTSCLHRGEISG